MQSAFIDIGLDRDGFLYVSDVVDTIEEFERLESGDEDEDEREAGSGKPRGRPAEDRGPDPRGPGDHRPDRQGAAGHQGRPPHQPRDDGGAVPGVHADGGPHRRVAEDRVARGARRAFAASSAQFREKQGFTGGVIIRTAAASRPDEDIVSDLVYFQKIWGEVRQRVDSVRAPAVVYREQGLVTKLVRDLLTDEFTAIRIDDRPGVPAGQGDGGPRDAVDGGRG